MARADDLDIVAVVEVRRFDEPLYRIYGTLDGVPRCLAATLRNGTVRGISFRRPHLKAYRGHV
ncbi:BrnT family toxin (plasmid) [Polymorphobacter sp. PAMC 29334]|uniref:BrnT family toxin n=1 Tax=Polymorphobacter sp. PAMC 29334 TaxID=2862331 RepID=UPI001C75B462|nr:BrnT family toxin [Polymorphobacter sp. PAMC 29334]QYE33010.1 BrnT family toxin [Polymorphobacter sp. PAMC 29334]